MPTKHAQPPRKLYRNNKTGIPGVYWHAATQTYCVQGLLNGKRTTIAYTKDLNEAARISKQRRVTVTQPSPGIIYMPLPPNDLSSGFKQTLTALLAEGRHEEAAIVQPALDRIEAAKASGANIL